MVVKFPRLSSPLTALALVRAVHSKVIQQLLQSLVGKQGEIFIVACWTSMVGSFDLMNTLLTETLSTAGGLVRLSENKKTDGTLCLDAF